MIKPPCRLVLSAFHELRTEGYFSFQKIGFAQLSDGADRQELHFLSSESCEAVFLDTYAVKHEPIALFQTDIRDPVSSTTDPNVRTKHKLDTTVSQ